MHHSDPLDSDPLRIAPIGNNGLHHRPLNGGGNGSQLSSDSMVSLISGLSDSATSNQFSLLGGGGQQGKRYSQTQRLLMSLGNGGSSINGSEDGGGGLGRRSAAARRSARLNVRPQQPQMTAMMNEVNGDGGIYILCRDL